MNMRPSARSTSTVRQVWELRLRAFLTASRRVDAVVLRLPQETSKRGRG
jgi:hypothetical protein